MADKHYDRAAQDLGPHLGHRAAVQVADHGTAAERLRIGRHAVHGQEVLLQAGLPIVEAIELELQRRVLHVQSGCRWSVSLVR